MNGTKVAKPKNSKNVGEAVDTTAQAAGIIAGRYLCRVNDIKKRNHEFTNLQN